MKCKIIVKKDEEVKEANIEIASSIEQVAKVIQSHGWRVEYFEPIEDIHEDEDTQIIDIGRFA